MREKRGVMVRAGGGGAGIGAGDGGGWRAVAGLFREGVTTGGVGFGGRAIEGGLVIGLVIGVTGLTRLLPARALMTSVAEA